MHARSLVDTQGIRRANQPRYWPTRASVTATYEVERGDETHLDKWPRRRTNTFPNSRPREKTIPRAVPTYLYKKKQWGRDEDVTIV
ncbi:hypothetical protein EVAR_90067_1 [Eumeta japonica]|uniref:Uncharacterized protein n=1 Tax=Eumeta variegata TaxID=151549 RepID=A0A4C2AB74_EUMVA|nr:hypothetical protein EVAR_90067_1 [Eumeta japonica]